MAILTQGTQIYFIDPADDSVKVVEGAKAFNPGGAPADQIETTPLEVNERTYLRGLRTPGQASLTIDADPRKASHIRLHELSEDDSVETIHWAVGWSDGTAAPTVDGQTGEFVLPSSRTWFTFQGYVSDFPFDFQGNAVVSTQVTIQRSGGSAWSAKAGA